ncbi:MAG: GTP cyclohydrolase I FolE [Flavobacterium sp.]|uniref:GTP cyclohydrolase I FolE n=1 Tax=Flavobacterium sp. TaxID=239 RepID=UPI00260D3945|nr:GTP cyclohydrolase I FolE [Flavobacterium sp.]MDD5150846.1 GTP cyclohydrolase I FolE [Flavobacterium sp.]
MKDKTDKILGKIINQNLYEKGFQTPLIDNGLSNQEKVDLIETHFRQILITLGLDIADDSISGTPNRMAEMYVNELCNGLDFDQFPKCTTVDNKFKYSDLIIEKCTIKSLCEHHFVYFGTAHQPEELGCWVAYIPDKKVIGLSKINRIVSYFSHRPQIQERLAHQIAETLKYVLEVDSVAVIIKAQHFCVLTRGVEDENGFTITSSLHGLFESDRALRSELMSIVNK